jgi:hypothetical protein
MTLTLDIINKAKKALSEEYEKKPTKPVIVMSQLWMKWLAKQIGVPYRKEIDTGYILYVESRRIP